MIGIERNKDPELTPKERNTSHFVILDDRKHGRSGKFPVFYDVDTGDYLEPPEGFLESEYQTLKEWYNARGEAGDVTKEDVYTHHSPVSDSDPVESSQVGQESPEPASVLDYDPGYNIDEMEDEAPF